MMSDDKPKDDTKDNYFKDDFTREFFNDKFATLCLAMGYLDKENSALESKQIVSATRYRSAGFKILVESIAELRRLLTDEEDKKIAAKVNELFYPESGEKFIMPLSRTQVLNHEFLETDNDE